MNQAIADIIKSHIEGLDFVDKIAGLVRTLTFDIKGPDNTPVQKSFPVACCVTADDCKDGAYNELMPNSQYKTVIYFEDMGVSAGDIEGRYSYWTSNVRLVCWINAAKILGDTCQTGTACTLSAHLIAEIVRALPEFKQHHNPFNMVLSKVTGQEVSSPSIFSQYTYDEKHTQYLMYPYDYFALDIQTEFAICRNGTGVYDSDCGHRTDTLDAPVATAGTGATSSSFVAHCNAVTGATGYAIDIATDGGFTDFVLMDERIGNLRDVTISNLDQGTMYYYRFRAYNDFIESESSNTISVLLPGAVDVDGNEYTSIIVGNLQWLTSNLLVTKYNDGTPIPNVTGNAAWAALNSGAYCWYNNDIANKAIYGGLYNWHAVNSGILAPAGYRVANNADWTALIAAIGGASTGGKLKETGLVHWHAPNTGALNHLGFLALGAGFRNSASGAFASLLDDCDFWSLTNYDATRAYRTNLRYDSAFMTFDYNGAKTYGFSVRCVKDVL